MSDERDEPAVDVEIEHPHVHRHRPAHHWIDLAVPVAALFISLISIFIAWHHGEVMKELVGQNARLVRSNSLPYLQLYQSSLTPEGQRRLALVVSNQGVGPGEVRTAEVLVDGKPQPDLESVLAACCRQHSYEGIRSSSLFGRMIRPGEVSEYVYLPVDASNEEAAKFLRQAMQTRFESRICFCSVFDECWTASSKEFGRPKAVANCPPVKVTYGE